MSIGWLVFMGSLFTTVTYWTFGFRYVKNKMEENDHDTKN
jgi:hypothetical protein